MYDVCIIGGGQSGLVTLKTFAEKTDNIIVLEKCNKCTGYFSGIKEQDLFKWSTSRYMSGFSDFPMPKSIPVWFTIRDYVNYLMSYKSHFGLDKYIHYNSIVKKCYQNEKEEWVVDYNNTKLVCKKLIICTGLNQTPKYPDIINNFSGEIIHTDDVYRKMDKMEWHYKFNGKRVLLLGGAESAYDIGHILAETAGKLYYSTKNYTEWFPKGNEEPELIERMRKIDNTCLNKIYEIKGDNMVFKTPTDTLLTYLEYSLPEPMSQLFHEYMRKFIFNTGGFLEECGKCSHQHAGLCKINETPDNLFKKYVVKRTEFLLDMFENKAEIVYYPDKIEGTKVYTKEKTLEDIDIIVSASGYKKKFSFLADDVWQGEFIKKMVPVKYKNIAFIGYARPTMGSIAAVAEMQGWWLQKYFDDSTFKYSIRKPFFRTLDPLNVSNEHINTIVIGCFYLKDLAKDLKIEPNMFYLLFTDFPLFFKIYTGTCHPMMYRIHGYKSHSKARNILMDTYISNNERYMFDWKYNIFHFSLHVLFILILFIIGFLVSYSIYKIKGLKRYRKYKKLSFIILSCSLVLFFYWRF